MGITVRITTATAHVMEGATTAAMQVMIGVMIVAAADVVIGN